MARKTSRPVPLDAPRDGKVIRLFVLGDIGSWSVRWDGAANRGAGMWRSVYQTKVFVDDARFVACMFKPGDRVGYSEKYVEECLRGRKREDLLARRGEVMGVIPKHGWVEVARDDDAMGSECPHVVHQDFLVKVESAVRPTQVRLSGVRHGHPTTAKDDDIYAVLHDAHTGELLVNATLDYILNAVKTRGYVLVE